MLPTRPVVVAFVFLVVFYYLFGRKYAEEIKQTYNYNLLGLPTILAIAGPVVLTLMAWAGVGDPDPNESVISVLLRMLLFATPGVVIAVVTCMAKTQNIKMALLIAAFTYVVAIVAGGGIAVAIMCVVVWFGIKIFASEGVSTLQGSSRAGKCPRCGTRVSGAGTCPGCGVELR